VSICQTFRWTGQAGRGWRMAQPLARCTSGDQHMVSLRLGQIPLYECG
jgi:hypothetical protein